MEQGLILVAISFDNVIFLGGWMRGGGGGLSSSKKIFGGTVLNLTN